MTHCNCIIFAPSIIMLHYRLQVFRLVDAQDGVVDGVISLAECHAGLLQKQKQTGGAIVSSPAKPRSGSSAAPAMANFIPSHI